MSDRCTGHCCRAFPLPWSLEEMKIRYKKASAARGRGEDVNLDYIKVYPMLIPLPPAPRPVEGPIRRTNQKDAQFWYTCKNHDADTGNCLNYAHRPEMCRGFPNYKEKYDPCRYASCTLAGARIKPPKLRVLG